MDNCKETGDIFVLESAEEGVGKEKIGLKRKVSYSDGEFRYSTSLVQRRIFRRVIGETENTKSKETSSLNDPCCSCCSSHGSTDIDKEASEFSDLEEEQIGDISTSTYGLDSCRESERRETMPLSDHVIAESFDLKVTGELPSDVNYSSSLYNEAKIPSSSNTEQLENIFKVADVNPSRRSKRAKMPSNAELEEFFSVTENDLMRQFSHKYNFDFVKEEPFEGPYEWVRVSHDEHVLRS